MQAGYYLKSATECVAFTSCTVTTSNACSACDSGYVIASDATSCLVCGSHGNIIYVAGIAILAIFSALMI
jgi:hypothetical protein